MAAALPIVVFNFHSGIYVPAVDPAMIVTTVRQRAVSRLKRLFPQLFVLSNSGPCNLPLEIILMIAEYLNKRALKDTDPRFCVLSSCYIPYHYVRLVMNRHVFGPEHGLPLQTLSKRNNYTDHKYGVERSISQHARIFSDELLVLTAVSMTQLRGDLVLLRSYVEFCGGSICQHLTISQGSPDCIPIQFDELPKKGNASGPFPVYRPMYGSCNWFLTYYSINITWQGVGNGYSIGVLWRTMATRDLIEKSRSAYSPQNPPGSIRGKWNEAGGVEEITGGKWRRALRAAGLG
ncbi:hypothetical protein COCMIDRAFT_41316 [Bipolaris oryzae ATCC 44560]|uniref:Uncharacterized protein n=1 Tax=Bipolaris oryzae ATCC 44560 TaxID=930090 RepID=W6YRT4_COCMI|nr:uncharacterized protein COCMIDRAFT_41316 [Bipolaris oryzae ATCC 44560]EUC40330.1 hypothetical protein COCMIDRAFT_41316 [Bipolaris oryzae ATCC 44560]